MFEARKVDVLQLGVRLVVEQTDHERVQQGQSSGLGGLEGCGQLLTGAKVLRGEDTVHVQVRVGPVGNQVRHRLLVAEDTKNKPHRLNKP